MLKFSKKEKVFKKEKKGFWLNINLYWRLTVSFMFGVVIASFAFGYYLFIKINKEPVFTISSDNSQVGTIKKERIDKVLEFFSERKQKSDQILNSPAPVIDPSL